MILLFVLLFSIFVIKPITLTLIRWITFKKIHNDELSISQITNNKITQNKVKDLSKTMYSELDEVDKESKEDFEKIEKIINYPEKRKEE